MLKAMTQGSKIYFKDGVRTVDFILLYVKKHPKKRTWKDECREGLVKGLVALNVTCEYDSLVSIEPYFFMNAFQILRSLYGSFLCFCIV